MQQTQPKETNQANLPPTANLLGNPPFSGHQVFVLIPDTWLSAGVKRPAYTQTMPIPTSLGTLIDGLAQLLSIPTQAFRIQYGGKILNHHRSLAAQGVRKKRQYGWHSGGSSGEQIQRWKMILTSRGHRQQPLMDRLRPTH